MLRTQSQAPQSLHGRPRGVSASQRHASSAASSLAHPESRETSFVMTSKRENPCSTTVSPCKKIVGVDNLSHSSNKTYPPSLPIRRSSQSGDKCPSVGGTPREQTQTNSQTKSQTKGQTKTTSGIKARNVNKALLSPSRPDRTRVCPLSYRWANSNVSKTVLASPPSKPCRTASSGTDEQSWTKKSLDSIPPSLPSRKLSIEAPTGTNESSRTTEYEHGTSRARNHAPAFPRIEHAHTWNPNKIDLTFRYSTSQIQVVSPKHSPKVHRSMDEDEDLRASSKSLPALPQRQRSQRKVIGKEKSEGIPDRMPAQARRERCLRSMSEDRWDSMTPLCDVSDQDGSNPSCHASPHQPRRRVSLDMD